MEEITIPYHLFIPTLHCIGLLLFIFFQRRRIYFNNKLKWLWISLTVFLTIYTLIVGSATVEDIYYQWDVNRYDLNKDGSFDGIEITNQQEAAMRRLVNDTGRNLSVITGFVFSMLISIPVYIIGIICQRLISKNKNYTQQ